jgi:superfamily I DNA/RNA helicase
MNFLFVLDNDGKCHWLVVSSECHILEQACLALDHSVTQQAITQCKSIVSFEPTNVKNVTLKLPSHGANDILDLYDAFKRHCTHSDSHTPFPLTQEQEQVVRAPQGYNIVVRACAGSGKTTTTVHRIKYLIHHGVAPSSIMLMTFTRDAAALMIKRLIALIGPVPDLIAGTIDSIAYRFLRSQSLSFHEDSPEAADVGEFGQEFLVFLKRAQPVFFKQFRYVFVDEMQDVNTIQYQIIHTFYKHGVNIFGVGDTTQNIYTFRGSNNKYIREFEKRFPPAKAYYHSINFRSHHSIVKFASHVSDIPMVPAASSQSPLLPRICHFANVSEQYDMIMKIHQQCKTAGESLAILSPLNGGIRDLKALMNAHKENAPIHMSTIHKAKGLEWDVVILINMSDDCIPMQKTKSAIDEGKRLFYVAITRAKRVLYIFFNRADVTRYMKCIPPTYYRA